MAVSILKGAAILLVRIYIWILSPLIHTLAGPGNGCRFNPSCSHYALEAIRTHGTFVGVRLAVARILRCRPGVPGGWDPPPAPRQ